MTALLRVATIGAGYFSQFHYDAWSRLDVELAAVCDHDQEAAHRVARDYNITGVYDDVETMLDAVQPDLVDIITPPATHLHYIELAAGRRAAVVCQKPFTENLDQALEAVAAGERNQTPVIVHENFRFQPWYGRIKRMLEQGTLGEPFQVSFRLRPGDGQGARAYLDRQPYFQKMPRFLVHETAIHMIDVFRYLFGEVDNVFAQLARLNPVIQGEDAGLVLFRFRNGIRGLFDGNRLVDHAAGNRRLTMGEMLVEGAAATLRLDGDGRLFLREHGSNDESPVPFEWRNRGFAGDSVFRFQRHVVQHLTAGEPLFSPACDYVRNIRIEQAIYASSAAGAVVGIDDPSGEGR